MLDPKLAATALGLGGCLAVVASAVAIAGDLPRERDVLEAAQAQTSGVVAVADGVDAATGYAAVAAAAAAVVMWLLVVRRPADAARVALAVTGSIAAASLLKRAVERQRPDLLSPLAEVSPFSFPSGHATATAALAVAVALAARPTRGRVAAAVAAVLLVAVAAAAQLVLARHYPSDIVGGWLLAAACATGVWSVRRRRA